MIAFGSQPDLELSDFEMKQEERKASTVWSLRSTCRDWMFCPLQL